MALLVLTGGIATYVVTRGSGSSKHTVRVELTYRKGLNLYTPGSPCIVAAGVDLRVVAGDEVHVLDGSDSTVGVGTLGAGVHEDGPGPGDGDPTRGIGDDTGTCTFSVAVQDVPDEAVYSVSIGGSQGPSFSKQELANANWTISLTP